MSVPPAVVPATVGIPPDSPAFRIGRTPVTNRQYRAFLKSRTDLPPPPWWNDPGFSAPEQPVVGVTWEDASAYCAWLSETTGNRWRLPTESEWETAMAAGLPSPRTPWGNDLPPGEIPEGPLAAPWETGRGAPNAFGVFDPGTVVHEWCADWRESPERGAGPSPPPRRASRGGSWRHRVRWSAPSARSSLPPSFRYSDYGFRVLLESRG